MTTEPTPNVPLLRKAVEWAQAEYEREGGGAWFQSSWLFDVDDYVNNPRRGQKADRLRLLASEHVSSECGTAYCIAGYVAHLGGVIDGFTHLTNAVTTGEAISEYAERVLGLTDAEAGFLFSGGNDIVDVQNAAKWIASRAGETL